MDTIAVLAKTGAVAGVFMLTARLLLQWDEERQVRIASRVLLQVQKQLQTEADSTAMSDSCAVQAAAQRRAHSAGSAEIANALITHAPGHVPIGKATSMRCCRFECNESSFRSTSSRQTWLLNGPPRSKSASSNRCPSETSGLGVSFGNVSPRSAPLQLRASQVLSNEESKNGIEQSSWDCQVACLVFGSITMDLHAVVDGLVRKSDLSRLSALGRFTASPGGKAANEAVGLCKLGVRTHLVARVGFDAMGVSLLEELSKVQAEHPSLDIAGVTTAEADVATGVSVQILAHAAEEQRPGVGGSESSHRSAQAAAEPSLRRASTGSCAREQSGAARGAPAVEECLADSVSFLSKVISSGANEDVSVCGDEVAYALGLLRSEEDESEASAARASVGSSADGCGASSGGDACMQPEQPKLEVGVLLLQLEVSIEPMRVLAAAARAQGTLVALKASPLGPGRTFDKARLLLGGDGDGEAEGLVDLLFIGGVEASLLLESEEEVLTTSDAAAAAEAIMATWRSLRAVVVLCDAAYVLLTRSAALGTRASPADRLSAADTSPAAECSECDVDNPRASAKSAETVGERSGKTHGKEKKLLLCLPCTRRKLVDSLGFKDAFVSGFIGGHCIGLSLREALLWGYGSSVLSLSAPGAQGGLPSRTELVAFLTKNLPLLPWEMHSSTHAPPILKAGESARRDSAAGQADSASAAWPYACSSSSDFLSQTYWHQAVCRADVACLLVMACMHPRGLDVALGQRDAFGATPLERAYACWHQTGRRARYGAVLRMLAAAHILLHTLRTCSMFEGSYQAEHGLWTLARHTDVVDRLLPGLNVGLCLEPSASRAQVVGLGVDLFSALLLCPCAAEERAAINSLLLHYLDACEAHCCHLNALRSGVTARSEAKLHAAAVAPAEEGGPLVALRRSDTDDGIFKTRARLHAYSISAAQRSGGGRSTATWLQRGGLARSLRNASPVRNCIFSDALLCHRTADGHTLLMHAVMAGATRLVERLVRLCRSRLQYRHTLHARTSTCGSSALHFATQSGNLHTCRALIKGGLNIYYKRFDGQSALECCAPHIADTIKALHTSGRSFAAFLSHAKKDAAATARTLKDYLQTELQREVFLDCDNLHRLSELQNNVRDTEVFVQLQTRHVLERPYCLLELLTAIDAGVPIVLVEVASNSDEYTFDHEEASAFLADLENTLMPWAWNELLRWRPADRRETAELLYSTIVHTVSRKIDFGAPKRVLDAMLRELAETIRASAAGFEHESEATNMSTPLGGRYRASPPMIKRDMTY